MLLLTRYWVVNDLLRCATVVGNSLNLKYMNRTFVFISLTSIALLALLIIQVNWILNTAKVKEQLFNEKANMVLSKTAEALSADSTTYRNLQIFAGKNEVHKVDSLFNHYMRMYNIHIAYFFEVNPSLPSMESERLSLPFIQDKKGTYTTCLENEPGENGVELKLVFPKKEQFIREEMGIPFITSVVLIVLVLLISWHNILSLQKEKKIAEHVSDFLNNMTHEFKTPVTNIALAGKMILREMPQGAENKIGHYSGIILEENEKLRFQVEQVLNMAALERGEMLLQHVECDAHQLLLDCLKRMSLQLDIRKGSVAISLEAANFTVNADKVHLSNTFCNLIDNAIKYSSGKPELTITSKNEQQWLIIEISDRGIGIEKQYQKKVFDKFFRVPTGNVHDVKGSGLGLAYLKKIIALHGGTIELQSEKGKGTTFAIKLPYV